MSHTMSQISSLDFHSAGSMYKNPYGRRDINFSPDGRFMNGDREATFPRRSQQPQGRRFEEDFRSYDGHRERRRNIPRRPLREASTRPYVGPYPPRRRKLEAQNYLMDRYRPRRPLQPAPNPSYFPRPYHVSGGSKPHPQQWTDRRPIVEESFSDTDNDGERPTIFSCKYPLGLLFLVTGILMVFIAIFDTIFSNEGDRNYYCGFWTGCLAIELGIFGMLHKGDYDTRWKSYNYMLISAVVSICAFISTGLICERFVQRCIRMGEATSRANEILSYQQATDWPIINVTLNTEQLILTSIGMDATLLTLNAVLYLAPVALAFVLHHFWEKHYHSINRVAPLCSPILFNPWGQIPLGCSTVFFGIITVFTATGTSWASPGLSTAWSLNTVYWITPLVGFVILLASFFGAAAVKLPYHIGLTCTSLLFLFISVAGCVISVVFNVLGLVDNINALRNGQLIIVSNALITSTVFFAISTFLCLTAFFYGIGIIILVISAVMRQNDDKSSISSETSYDSRDDVIHNKPKQFYFPNRQPRY